MKIIYRHAETGFEKLTSIATVILGNSITFIFAFCLVLFWWINNYLTNTPNIHEIIGDIIFGSTFLSLFIIQKSFNRFSAGLHLKVNELVAASDNARNTVMNVDVKTEHEIIELTKEYIDLAEQIEEDNDHVPE
ncbi:low affinity iron permease family protein [Flavobacterium sp.]|uniref:low affinity iron permease family protein n=1 Tax=Flavobacterium sp. TaxID=239 RepID=UPI00286C436D|nr:low affinity iron permease family protein [Flavobacterium sp.]